MNRLILPLILALAAPAHAKTVEIAEIPDAFNPIPLVDVSWGKRSSEGKAARKACGGDFEFVSWRWEESPRRLIHIAECK